MRAIEKTKCFNNQAHLLRITGIFEWSDKQAVADLKHVAAVAQASVERTSLRLRYNLNELRLWPKENTIESIMLQQLNLSLAV